MNDRLIIYTLF